MKTSLNVTTADAELELWRRACPELTSVSLCYSRPGLQATAFIPKVAGIEALHRQMDDEYIESECSQRENKGSYFLMDEDDLDEARLDAEEHHTKRPQIMDCAHGPCCNSGAETELHGAKSFAYPLCVSQDTGTMRGEEERSRHPLLEYWVYLDTEHKMAVCHSSRPVDPSVLPVPDLPYLSVPIPSSTTATVSSTDLVSAAAHLHLLGESLTLIGHHLQETNKKVCMSSSYALLLDSLLCALAPLICLTTQIPELRSCTQDTQASTLENIAYVMPGL